MTVNTATGLREARREPQRIRNLLRSMRFRTCRGKIKKTGVRGSRVAAWGSAKIGARPAGFSANLFPNGVSTSMWGKITHTQPRRFDK